MMVKGFKCDVCNVERKDVNHWFLVWVGGHGIIDGGLLVKRWEVTDAFHPEVQHVCGQEHLNVLVSRWIEQQN